jgi:hypothetical protein
MPPHFAKLQAALRRREQQQGNRVMVKVLATVPSDGLEAVLVAVEVVLESNLQSAEHAALGQLLLELPDEPRFLKQALGVTASHLRRQKEKGPARVLFHASVLPDYLSPP